LFSRHFGTIGVTLFGDRQAFSGIEFGFFLICRGENSKTFDIIPFSISSPGGAVEAIEVFGSENFHGMTKF
jgi:hypothetical protein